MWVLTVKKSLPTHGHSSNLTCLTPTVNMFYGRRILIKNVKIMSEIILTIFGNQRLCQLLVEDKKSSFARSFRRDVEIGVEACQKNSAE